MPPALPLRRSSTAGPRPQPAGARQPANVEPAPKEAREFQARRGDLRTWDASAWETWLVYGGMA